MHNRQSERGLVFMGYRKDPGGIGKMGLFLSLPCRLLVVMAVLLATSCASLNAIKDVAGIENPTVSLSDMRITGLTMEGASILLTLNVDNPNPVPIDLAGFDYALLFDGKQLLAGEKRDRLKIDARGVSAVTVPVSLNFADLQSLYKGVAYKDSLDYELKTAALIDLPLLGVKRFPSSKKGEFPVPKIPEVSLRGIDIEKMGLSGAEVVINADIKNPNSFAVDVSQLVYSLSINGSKWLESALGESIKLTEKGKTRISIPLKLNFLEMGNVLYGALMEGKGLNYRLTGDMNLDTALPLLKNVKVPFDKSGVVGVQR